MNYLRVGAAVAFTIAISLLTLLFGYGGVFYYWLLGREDREPLRYAVERFWTRSLYRLVCCRLMRLSVEYDGGLAPETIETDQPVLLLGVHQSDLLHGVIGDTFLRLAGGSVFTIVKHDLFWPIRKTVQLLELAMVINRNEREESLEIIERGLTERPNSPVVILPCGRRPTPMKVAADRDKYDTTIIKNTCMPRPGGPWRTIVKMRRNGQTPEVRFVSHTTEHPDWRVIDLHRLVGTTVTVIVKDITDAVAACKSKEELHTLLKNEYAFENIRRGWSLIEDT